MLRAMWEISESMGAPVSLELDDDPLVRTQLERPATASPSRSRCVDSRIRPAAGRSAASGA